MISAGMHNIIVDVSHYYYTFRRWLNLVEIGAVRNNRNRKNLLKHDNVIL